MFDEDRGDMERHLYACDVTETRAGLREQPLATSRGNHSRTDMDYCSIVSH